MWANPFSFAALLNLTLAHVLVSEVDGQVDAWGWDGGKLRGGFTDDDGDVEEALVRGAVHARGGAIGRLDAHAGRGSQRRAHRALVHDAIARGAGAHHGGQLRELERAGLHPVRRSVSEPRPRCPPLATLGWG